MQRGTGSAPRRAVLAAVAAVVLAVPLTPVASPQVGATGTFSAGGSVEQVHTSGHAPGVTVELVDAGDVVVATGVTDAQGAFLFREVAPGAGYGVRRGAEEVDGLDVLAPRDHPDASFYDGVVISEGYGYVPTRDGTLLAVNVTFPTNGAPPPWPVVVDYSGYDPAQPGGAPAEAALFPFLGYVTVGVNMRGTGCSGGAFDLFETLQSLDGYDVIEALAAQDWSNGDVGMVGISYPGISQLFVAATRPPHLRAITPLSTLADLPRGIAYPGGIRNIGFPLEWLEARDQAARPAAAGWAQQRIADGDVVCADNQVLRLQSRDFTDELQPDRLYDPAFDYLVPDLFVDRIAVPTYLSGAFQDEQTGGYWATMVPRFGDGLPLRVTLTNGTHVEGLGPDQLQHLAEFVDFYVGRRVPVLPPLVRVGASLLYQDLFGTAGVTFPPDRFAGYGSYGEALAAYEAEPPVRVLWENGAGRNPGEPFATVEQRYGDFPIPGTTAQAWYLQPDGELAGQPSTVTDDAHRGRTTYRYEPQAKVPRTFAGSTEAIWKPLPALDWRALEEGTAASFVTPAFTQDTAYAGSGSVDLWIRPGGVDDIDLEVTITEVRPDGRETYIQSGWLRASRRDLDPDRSTDLRPVHPGTTALPLADGVPTLVRVELFPFAHVFRPGSRLRLNVEVPGGNRPFWVAEPLVFPGPVTNEVLHTAAYPSRVVLPLLDAASTPDVPDALPACPGLRGQACRDYRPARIPTAVTATSVEGAIEVTWRPPPTDEPVLEYLVDVLGGGAVITVPGDTTTLRYTAASPGALYHFQVSARFADGRAPASNPSLGVWGPDPASVTTTTTVPPAPAPAPPSSSGAVPATAAPAAATATGTLPSTGSDPRSTAVVAVLLVGLGVAASMLAQVTRRGRRAPRRPAGGRSAP